MHFASCIHGMFSHGRIGTGIVDYDLSKSFETKPFNHGSNNVTTYDTTLRNLFELELINSFGEKGHICLRIPKPDTSFLLGQVRFSS